jgi:foldase protein PrsA
VLSPVTKTPRIILALGAFFVLAFTVAACGSDSGSNDSVPSDAVASVDGTPITRTTFDARLRTNALSSAQGGTAVVPDPPAYTDCVAELRRQAAAARSRTRQSDAQLRTQCRSLYDQLMRTTVAQLAQEEWIIQEARALGVTVSDATVQRQLDETKRQSFPRRGDYERFLRTQGMTNADVLERLKVQALATRITDKIQRSAGAVTNAEIADYYNRNKAQFAVPERRDLEIILTRREDQANAAKAALRSGESWAAVARRFSTDATSKANGGRLIGVAKGQQDRALDTAAFSAKKGVLVGPVRGQFGWYLVEVTRITPGRQSSLDDSRAQIRSLLTQTNGQRKLQRFGTDFQNRFVRLTVCRAGYVVEMVCKNAPRARTPTSTAGGAVVTNP